jgi:HK97 family phage major capsid protein
MMPEHTAMPDLEIKALLHDVVQAGPAGDDVITDAEPQLKALRGEVAELKGELERWQRVARRPALIQRSATEGDLHAQAFLDGYVRKGLSQGLAGLESKALNITTAGEGGYAIPESLDQTIERKLRDISPIRAIASVVQVGSADYKKLIVTAGAASGWVAETGARTETASPQFTEIVPPMGELYANPAATQPMLDDAQFDVETWLAEEIALEFAQKEAVAFITGNGTNKPKGFLSYTSAATSDASRAFGTLQHVATGTSAGFPASNPADKLIDLVQALRPAYRSEAVFVMNSKTLAVIRKFKDTTGQFLWQPSLMADQPDMLLGYPVVEAEDMPDIGADSLSVAFGNFRRGYVIAERGPVRVLRDPYSNKPFIHFYSTQRLGGAVVNSEAIKLLKFGTA